MPKERKNMQDKSITIKYREFASTQELQPRDQALLQAAVSASDGAYAPYSKFQVGAAVELENGQIISASNQENAAYPSGLCAERNALFFAHSRYPDVPVTAIAIAAKTAGRLTEGVTYPCGACRQVMQESQIRGKKPIRVIIGSANKVEVIDSIAGLLPFAFDNLPVAE